MRKLIKKMGGKVWRGGDGSISNTSEGYFVDSPDGRSVGPFPTRESAERQITTEKGWQLDTWTVTIPREWKKKVKQGLPYFAIPAAGLLGSEAYQSNENQ